MASNKSMERDDVKRTLSIDSLKPRSLLTKTNSLTGLFKRKRGRAQFECKGSSDSSSDDENSSTEPLAKRAKQLDTETAERERELDEKTEPQYRKYRPKGFPFNAPPVDRPIRIYADGVFDLFHIGHMKQLEQCKKAFTDVTLVCGVPSDLETHKRKGLTVLSDAQRCESLRHCRWVDEVVPNAPWCVTKEFLDEHKIDYVAHDDLPYASTDSDDIYRPIKEQGRFLVTQRTDGISTSDIITKIIKDYDKYLMRNFARGATREELNVSWLKKNELDFKKHINEFRQYWRKTNANFNNASKDLYCEVREHLRGRSGKSDDGSSTLTRSQSPATEFASHYAGHQQLDSQSDSDEDFTTDQGEVSESENEGERAGEKREDKERGDEKGDEKELVD